MAARKRPPQERGLPAPYGPFVVRLTQVPHLPAQCSIRVAEYPAFRAALLARLQAAGLEEEQVMAALHGRLSGMCPRCEVRLSLEYLEALCGGAELAGALARFTQGYCVNVACPSQDIVLCWRP